MSLNQSLQIDGMTDASLDEAVVIGGGNDKWIIKSDSGVCTAKKAFSCLVSPEIGDRVLRVVLPSGETNILAILERKQTQTTRLNFSGDVDISSNESIRMIASKRFDAISGDEMNLNSSQFSLRSNITSMLFDRLNLTGNETKQSIGKVQLITKYLETVSETSRQVMSNSFRLISGLDSVSAGEALQNIKKRFTVQSKQVSLLAEDDAKLNGKRVHLG